MTTHFAHAYEKGIDSLPRKTSIVASLVRDRYVADAVVILENTPRRAAKAVLKAVQSANANLLNNTGVSIDPKTIRIARIFVTSGTRMRRYVPASRGRALPYEKISSNIFVEVAGEEKVKKAEKPAEEKVEKAAAKKSKKTEKEKK
ncbi:50S ribosomal protein L22 [Candidatus Saccharibacteria bacterium]|nr:50S ribosomal protein L22 [Candidatus Saccharibacteria bacterium]